MNGKSVLSPSPGKGQMLLQDCISGSPPLPFVETCSLALRCNLDSEQGCACLEKAAVTFTLLGGEATSPGD